MDIRDQNPVLHHGVPGDVVGESVNIQQHIDTFRRGNLRRDVFEQQVGEVVERVLDVVVLLVEGALLIGGGLGGLLFGEHLSQIGENHLLLILEMLLHLLPKLGIEVGDKVAVFPSHRLQQRVEVVFDMGQLVFQVVLVRMDEILQDVGHPALLQLVGRREIVILTIDAADKQEERLRNAMFRAELSDALLAEPERDSEPGKYC